MHCTCGVKGTGFRTCCRAALCSSPRSHHEPRAARALLQILDHPGRTHLSPHPTLVLSGKHPQSAPFSPQLCSPALLPLGFVAPLVWPRLVPAVTGDKCVRAGSVLLSGDAGAGAVFCPSGCPCMWHLEHRAALQADRAPGSPSSRQVHVPLVNQQVPDTAHVVREGR